MLSLADELLARMGSGDVNGVPLVNGDEVMIISGSELGWRGVIVGAEKKGRLRGYKVHLTCPADKGGRERIYCGARLFIKWFYAMNVELPVSQALVRVRLMQELVHVASPRFLRRAARSSR